MVKFFTVWLWSAFLSIEFIKKWVLSDLSTTSWFQFIIISNISLCLRAWALYWVPILWC